MKAFANATPSATPQAPSVPLNLVATGGGGYIGLTWNAQSSIGTQTISDYKIYRGDSTAELTYFSHTSSTATTFYDSGPMNGMTYYYTIVAVNTVGDSAQSASAHASTTPPAGAPSGNASIPDSAPAAGPATVTICSGSLLQVRCLVQARFRGVPELRQQAEVNTNKRGPPPLTIYFLINCLSTMMLNSIISRHSSNKWDECNHYRIPIYSFRPSQYPAF